MVKEFDGKARFVVENYGDSELAKRFGVKRYPAIFVDDVLVATPKDFGFYGKGGEGEGGGRYAPLRTAASHERFRSDLAKIVGLMLAGRKDAARAAVPASPDEIAKLPSAALAAMTDLDGKPLSQEMLAGRVVLVEFWATWCPPCRGTLSWLGDLRMRHGDRVAVVTIAIESDEADVRKLAAEMNLPVTWVLGSADRVRAFGDVSAVPTLLMFDRDGRAAGAFYGAPPSLHADAEARLEELLK